MALRRRGQGQQILFRHVCGWNNIRDLWLARCQRAGLVDKDHVGRVQRLHILAALDQKTPLCGRADRGHHRDRRRERE